MKNVFLILLIISPTMYSQGINTLKFIENTEPPRASLENVSWITGHWRGEAFGGITEEIWSPPLGDSMMFSFKLVTNDKVSFYELGFIREINNTLFLQLKHFHGDLKGWEEKDETVDFKLVKIEKNRVYFDQFTIEKVNDEEINIYVIIHLETGKEEEVKFNYKRY